VTIDAKLIKIAGFEATFFLTIWFSCYINYVI